MRNVALWCPACVPLRGFLLCFLLFGVYKSLIDNRENLQRAPQIHRLINGLNIGVSKLAAMVQCREEHAVDVCTQEKQLSGLKGYVISDFVTWPFA